MCDSLTLNLTNLKIRVKKRRLHKIIFVGFDFFGCNSSNLCLALEMMAGGGLAKSELRESVVLSRVHHALALARANEPADRVGNPNGLNPSISCELESTTMGVDAHLGTRPDILHEDFATRISEHPNATVVVMDREAFASVLKPRRLRAGHGGLLSSASCGRR
jgi:hypothetical protein